tara:strand:+ start:4419 stop:5201 length:783 start_codon:yes stop_codon:yes gene_type:complete
MSRRLLFEITMRAYSFDWDDNILHMPTMVYMEKKDGDGWKKVRISTGEYAEIKDSPEYRYPGNELRNAFIEFDDDELFLDNVQESISNKDFAPSFNDFKEALLQGKTISIITARPTSPEALKKGILLIIEEVFSDEEKGEMVESIEDNYDFTGSDDDIINKYIESNYYYPVSFRDRDIDITKAKGEALDNFVKNVKLSFERMDTEKYNQMAIGFSDDDIDNIKEVVNKIEKELSKEHPEIKFYVYDTSEKGKNKLIVHTT